MKIRRLKLLIRKTPRFGGSVPQRLLLLSRVIRRLSIMTCVVLLLKRMRVNLSTPFRLLMSRRRPRRWTRVILSGRFLLFPRFKVVLFEVRLELKLRRMTAPSILLFVIFMIIRRLPVTVVRFI